MKRWRLMFSISGTVLRLAGLACGLGASVVWTAFLTFEFLKVIRLLI